MRKVPFIIFICLTFVFALMFIKGKNPADIESVMINKSVPKFNLKAPLGGKDFTQEDLKGEVSIVNVFSSWCLSCSAEHEVLKRIAVEQKVPLYGIDYKDKPEDLKKWFIAHDNIYKKVGSDRTGRVAIDFGVYGVPESFIVDKAGMIRYKHTGAITKAIYEERIKFELEELRK